MALPSATDVEYIGNGGSGGSVLGQSASELIAFYGKAPVAQRAYSSAVHATSAQASSTDFGVTQLATLNEILKVLQGVGLIPTS